VIFTSTDEATACMKEWQEILRLQDWDIILRIARRDDMGLDEVNGTCTWTLPRNEAIIKILDPIDYPNDCIFPQDQEVTLVHELLHLHYAPFSDQFTRDSLEYIGLERCIDVTAKTLVSLKRKGGDA
jgi:hypothetical protein